MPACDEHDHSGARGADLPPLARRARPDAAGVLYALELQGTLALTRHRVLRVPRCPACGAASPPPNPWFREIDAGAARQPGNAGRRRARQAGGGRLSARRHRARRARDHGRRRRAASPRVRVPARERSKTTGAVTVEYAGSAHVHVEPCPRRLDRRGDRAVLRHVHPRRVDGRLGGELGTHAVAARVSSRSSTNGSMSPAFRSRRSHGRPGCRSSRDSRSPTASRRSSLRSSSIFTMSLRAADRLSDEQRSRLRPDARGGSARRSARGRRARRDDARLGEPALASAAHLARRPDDPSARCGGVRADRAQVHGDRHERVLRRAGHDRSGPRRGRRPSRDRHRSGLRTNDRRRLENRASRRRSPSIAGCVACSPTRHHRSSASRTFARSRTTRSSTGRPTGRRTGVPRGLRRRAQHDGRRRRSR